MAAKTKKFEDELKDLETIVNQIDSGELSLDESIGAFERGVALVKSLTQKLDEVERKVEILTRDAEGKLVSEPLEDAEPPVKPRRAAADDDDIPF
ncbi:MAG TPA: exodeoxyribonuclease VII small subunit [Candidatus Binataceae bacterium]|nr:exodeoxyribonuclease VII small subunit [Candidatus Binataceae bacterium]